MASYMDPLVWIDEVTMEPKPGLATSWTFSKDGKTLTFALQNNVNWHDGTRFTADDVVFSFFVYRDDVDSAVRNIFQTMTFVQKVDKYTVEVTLNTPDAGFLFNAASQLMFQRKQYTKFWSANPEGERSLSGFNWTKSAPVGTGPFTVGNRSSTSIHVNRNDKYWQDPAHFKGVMFNWQPDTTSRLKAFTDGTADILWPVAAADLQLVKDTPGRVYVADAASVMFAAFNFNNPGRGTPTCSATSASAARYRWRSIAIGTRNRSSAATSTNNRPEPWRNHGPTTQPSPIPLAISTKRRACSSKPVGKTKTNQVGSKTPRATRSISP